MCAASASANATSSVKQVLYIDGALKATTTGTALSYNWNTRKATTGKHTLSVIATDSAGNSSTNTVSVTTD